MVRFSLSTLLVTITYLAVGAALLSRAPFGTRLLLLALLLYVGYAGGCVYYSRGPRPRLPGEKPH